mmetsp:Transcript_1796/g.4050  ORF Transcript_1796/g.4050 Transcript_1796/m.4050 type:complete len:674 (-) Transcript_1796:150-2171(-)
MLGCGVVDSTSHEERAEPPALIVLINLQVGNIQHAPLAIDVDVADDSVFQRLGVRVDRTMHTAQCGMAHRVALHDAADDFLCLTLLHDDIHKLTPLCRRLLHCPCLFLTHQCMLLHKLALQRSQTGHVWDRREADKVISFAQDDVRFPGQHHGGAGKLVARVRHLLCSIHRSNFCPNMQVPQESVFLVVVDFLRICFVELDHPAPAVLCFRCYPCALLRHLHFDQLLVEIHRAIHGTHLPKLMGQWKKILAAYSLGTRVERALRGHVVQGSWVATRHFISRHCSGSASPWTLLRRLIERGLLFILLVVVVCKVDKDSLRHGWRQHVRHRHRRHWLHRRLHRLHHASWGHRCVRAVHVPIDWWVGMPRHISTPSAMSVLTHQQCSLGGRHEVQWSLAFVVFKLSPSPVVQQQTGNLDPPISDGVEQWRLSGFVPVVHQRAILDEKPSALNVALASGVEERSLIVAVEGESRDACMIELLCNLLRSTLGGLSGSCKEHQVLTVRRISNAQFEWFGPHHLEHVLSGTVANVDAQLVVRSRGAYGRPGAPTTCCWPTFDSFKDTTDEWSSKFCRWGGAPRPSGHLGGSSGVRAQHGGSDGGDDGDGRQSKSKSLLEFKSLLLKLYLSWTMLPQSLVREEEVVSKEENKEAETGGRLQGIAGEVAVTQSSCPQLGATR